MAKKVVPTVCIVVVLFVIVFAQAIVGGKYFYDCPGIPFIPIYLCGPVFAFFVFWTYGLCNWFLWSATTTFFFIWYIGGNAVLYSCYEPDYNYCNKTLYLFAFWSTNLTNILLFMLLCCCYSERGSDNNIDVQI